MKLRPLQDKIVIKKLLEEVTTKGGLVLPGQDKEKPAQGEVIAVGPGGVIDDKEIKMEVEPGQKIVYSRYAGTEVELDGEKFTIIKQSDVLAVIED